MSEEPGYGIIHRRPVTVGELTTEGLEILQRTIAGYSRHPNFGGILLVGLGCEVNYLDCLMENMRLEEGPLLKTANIQTAGGTRETVRTGIEAVKKMLPEVNQVNRSKVSAKHIVLGLECGGSDAYSGISANPALGKAVDLLVQNGGTAILSETPEIYGAEHLLTRRAINQDVAQKLIDRIHWWEEYTAREGAEINNNPSPGNKAGGLTTILEKSLGAASKGGSTNLMDVYEYSQTVRSKGLVFMDTPGYDVVSITGMIAGKPSCSIKAINLSESNLLNSSSAKGFRIRFFMPVAAPAFASLVSMADRMIFGMGKSSPDEVSIRSR